MALALFSWAQLRLPVLYLLHIIKKQIEMLLICINFISPLYKFVHHTVNMRNFFCLESIKYVCMHVCMYIAIVSIFVCVFYFNF